MWPFAHTKCRIFVNRERIVVTVENLTWEERGDKTKFSGNEKSAVEMKTCPFLAPRMPNVKE
jgi:hypothetical protein